MKKVIFISLASIIVIILIIMCFIYNKKTIINMESTTLVKLNVNRGGTIKDVSFKGEDIFKKEDFINKKISEAPTIIINKEKSNKIIENEDEYHISITIDSENDKLVNKYKSMINKKRTIKLNKTEQIVLEYESCSCTNTVCKKSC